MIISYDRFSAQKSLMSGLWFDICTIFIIFKACNSSGTMNVNNERRILLFIV